jgi:hypothetical protein
MAIEPEAAATQPTDLELARSDHATALARKDRNAIASAAWRIWSILRNQPRYAWLNNPVGRL